MTGAYPNIMSSTLLEEVSPPENNWESIEAPLIPLDVRPFPRYGGVRLTNGNVYVFTRQHGGEWTDLRGSFQGSLNWRDARGARNLAYAILYHHGIGGEIDADGYAALHQRAFAEEVISNFEDIWILEGHIIEDWLALREGVHLP